jgi:hypothetical protein
MPARGRVVVASIGREPRSRRRRSWNHLESRRNAILPEADEISSHDNVVGLVRIQVITLVFQSNTHMMEADNTYTTVGYPIASMDRLTAEQNKEHD